MSRASARPANHQPLRVMAVAGARPNFMKIAPLLREMQLREGFEPYLVHTGQHYDAAMSESFFCDLRISAPNANLGVGSGPHGEQTGQILARIEKLMREQQPDAVLVVGDVNSTLAAALAAVKLQVPVAHVEAGLRSGDRSMPEEINRLLTDAISEWLFTTEPSGGENLRREGVDPARVHFVGNVMIDTLLENVERARGLGTLRELGVEAGAYAAVTLHRPSNVDDPERLEEVLGVLEELHQELPVVFPVHPRTNKAIQALRGAAGTSLRLIEPLGYLDFLRVMADARMVLTDSGGLQEETTVLGVPCLTLRKNTERPVTVTQGTNTIVGTNAATLRREVRKILDGKGKTGRVPDLWDGRAAGRIIDVLARDLGRHA